MQKVVIEKGSVQETLVIPLYARYALGERYPELFDNRSTKALLNGIAYDFSEQERLMNSAFGRFGALEVAQREYNLCWEVGAYLASHPHAAVVNLGCGLLNLTERVDNGTARFYNLDLPDVIAARNELMPPGPREHNLACDLNDHAWFDEVDASGGAIFVAAGVFYYFSFEQVRALLCAMAARFPGGVVCFDAVNKRGLKLMLKTVIEQTGMNDVGAYFHVSNPPEELGGWSKDFARVTAKSYMNGYRPLGTKYGLLNALLSWASDHYTHMTIVRVAFAPAP